MPDHELNPLQGSGRFSLVLSHGRFPQLCCFFSQVACFDRERIPVPVGHAGRLGQEARRLVSSAAQRVSLVTAVSPRALVDVLFVLAASLRLVRQLARLYGGRPGTLGLIKLMRHVIAHLAITGGMAASDSLVQQMLGHGIAAKLSQRLGEGILNGLLTARLGLAAIDVTRPLPFTALPRPVLADLARDLLRKREAEESAATPSA